MLQTKAVACLAADRKLEKTGALVGVPQQCPRGHILTYCDGSQLQYTHLRASMLAYTHINLVTLLQHFHPDEAMRVAKAFRPRL